MTTKFLTTNVNTDSDTVDSQHSSINTVTEYMLDDLCSVPLRRQTFLFATVFRPALEHTQGRVKWLLVALSLDVRRPGREAKFSPEPSSKLDACTFTVSYISFRFC